MMTKQIYLRYYSVNDDGSENKDEPTVYHSIFNLIHCGAPLNDHDEELECSQICYMLQDGEYVEINYCEGE